MDGFHLTSHYSFWAGLALTGIAMLVTPSQYPTVTWWRCEIIQEYQTLLITGTSTVQSHVEGIKVLWEALTITYWIKDKKIASIIIRTCYATNNHYIVLFDVVWGIDKHDNYYLTLERYCSSSTGNLEKSEPQMGFEPTTLPWCGADAPLNLKAFMHFSH